FLEYGGAPRELAVRRDHHGTAVEHQLVLPADQVHVHDPRAGVPSSGPADLEALGALAPVVRRGVDVRNDLHAAVAILLPQTPGPPRVLAHRDAEVRARESNRAPRIARFEVALLVEDAVVGELH